MNITWMGIGFDHLSAISHFIEKRTLVIWAQSRFENASLTLLSFQIFFFRLAGGFNWKPIFRRRNFLVVQPTQTNNFLERFTPQGLLLLFEEIEKKTC